MKQLLIVALLLFSIGIKPTVKAQEVPAQRAFRIGLLIPSVSYEQRLNERWSAEARFYAFGISSTYPQAAIYGGFNYQTKKARHDFKGLNQAYFCGNYISLQAGYLDTFLHNDSWYSIRISKLIAEYVWRRSKNNVFYELGIGTGIRYHYRLGFPDLAFSMRFTLLGFIPKLKR